MYTIYEIPGVKIGCTEQSPQKRARSQYYKDYKVLEIHSDIYIASDREIALQKEYGYPVDKIPYWKFRQRFTPEMVKAAAQKAVVKMHKKTRESGHMIKQAANIASLGGLSPNAGNKIIVLCVHCGKSGKLPPMKRWHFDNCKHKK